jgi:hypothetical protein
VESVQPRARKTVDEVAHEICVLFDEHFPKIPSVTRERKQWDLLQAVEAILLDRAPDIVQELVDILDGSNGSFRHNLPEERAKLSTYSVTVDHEAPLALCLGSAVVGVSR